LFSVGQGVVAFLTPASGENEFVLSYLVLSVALVAEGISFVRAFRQTRSRARDTGFGLIHYVGRSREPTTKTVLSEDSAALAGVIIAFAGVGLHQVTGDHRFEAAASLIIGLLLGYVAYALGRDTKGLLLGEAAQPAEKQEIRRIIVEPPEVEDVLELLTMAIGPNSLLVAARLNLVDGLTAERVEEVCTEIDSRIRKEVNGVTQVFLDPTSRSERHSGIGV
jgi:cation diffusion facilitator family transporter